MAFPCGVHCVVRIYRQWLSRVFRDLVSERGLLGTHWINTAEDEGI